MKREQVGVMNQQPSDNPRGFGDPGVMLILVYFVIIGMMFLVGKALSIGHDAGYFSSEHRDIPVETVRYPDGKESSPAAVRSIINEAGIFSLPPRHQLGPGKYLVLLA